MLYGVRVSVFCCGSLWGDWFGIQYMLVMWFEVWLGCFNLGE